MPQIVADDIRRQFWAVFLGSKVASDGQVPGFSRWWDQADDWQRHQGTRYADACLAKIERDHRDAEECVAAGVAAFRETLRLYVPKQRVPVDAPEVKQLVQTLTRTLGWSTPLHPKESLPEPKPHSSVGRNDVDESTFQTSLRP